MTCTRCHASLSPGPELVLGYTETDDGPVCTVCEPVAAGPVWFEGERFVVPGEEER